MELNLNESVSLEERKYGGFWIRVAAYLVDYIIVSIPMSIVFFLLFSTLSSESLDLLMNPELATSQLMLEQAIFELFGVFAIVWLICMFISILYFAGMHASKVQGTVGKMLLGLKVTDYEGNRISFWRGLGRYFAMYLSSVIFMIGFIMAGVTEKKQGLHDLIASTLVVKK
ncbi:RDD family protein [Mesobacillus zeae]|uniref:RDD family protein n=1 Tax=Mesobacillus zeae TaxID=1917180 RepID=A0A398BCB9_9BACI|nr:RDD family protein [Mesobacillus zeae]RID87819.1 RDD family protein [Mesobacillus zeae]